MNIVYPIKDKNLITKIKEKYTEKNNPRDLLLFLLAINTGIKLVELLRLVVSDVKGKNCLVIKEKNTKSVKTYPLNAEIQELAENLTKNRKSKEPLFISGFGKSIDRTQVYRNFKEICAELGIEESYSVTSWRKTFGYHYYIEYKDLSLLQWMFNQSSVNETMKFIDVKEDLSSRFETEFNL